MSDKKIFLFNIFYEVIFFKYLSMNYNNPFIFLSGKKDVFDDKEIILWTLLYLPVWVCAYYVFCQKNEISKYTIHRYKTRTKWWIVTEYILILSLTISYGTLYILLFLYYRVQFIYEVCILVFVHGIFILQIGVLIKIVTNKIIISIFGVIISEVMAAKTVSWNITIVKFFVPCWGMYNYSKNVVGDEGFSFIKGIIIQVCFIVVAYLLGIIINRGDKQ